MANKVYNDLNHSPFILEIENHTFYFSSVFHRNKFKKEYKEYCKNENLKFNNRYKVDIDLTDAFMIAFYKKVENRGFKVLNQHIEINENKKFKNIIL